MEGCSLHDAFPDAGGKPGRSARREERRRAATCGGPALAFLKAQSADLDPDRQTQTKLPPAEKVGGAGVGFKQEEDGFHDGGGGDLAAQQVNDVIGRAKAKTTGQAPDYFGKAPVDAYADFSSSPKDNPGYLLGAGQADFLGSFAAPGLGKAGGEATLATPMTNLAWKPMSSGAWSTGSGSATGSATGQGTNTSFLNSEDHATMVKKLDLLFARLEDLESRENVNGHIEVTMFILSGLFLLFGIETLRKF